MSFFVCFFNSHFAICFCRADHELFYGGEAVLGASHDAPQSYTCPFCARLGFTESSLVIKFIKLHKGCSLI